MEGDHQISKRHTYPKEAPEANLPLIFRIQKQVLYTIDFTQPPRKRGKYDCPYCQKCEIFLEMKKCQLQWKRIEKGYKKISHKHLNDSLIYFTGIMMEQSEGNDILSSDGLKLHQRISCSR